MGAKILALLETVDDEKLPHDRALTAKLLRYYANSWSQEAHHYWVTIDPTCSLYYGPFAQTAYTGGYLFSSINPTVASFIFEREGDGERYLVLLADITRMLLLYCDTAAAAVSSMSGRPAQRRAARV